MEHAVDQSLSFPPNYSELSEQHLQLSLDIAALVKLVPGGSLREIDQRANQLKGALQSHFSYEQDLMADLGYPNRDQHTRLHDKILSDLGATIAQLGQENIAKTIGHIEGQLFKYLGADVAHDQGFASFLWTVSESAAQ